MDYCCEMLERAISRGELDYDAVNGGIIFFIKSA